MGEEEGGHVLEKCVEKKCRAGGQEDFSREVSQIMDLLMDFLKYLYQLFHFRLSAIWIY